MTGEAYKQIVTPDEQDVYTRWRRRFCWTQRAGEVKAVKRITHRRARREARAEIVERRSERD